MPLATRLISAVTVAMFCTFSAGCKPDSADQDELAKTTGAASPPFDFYVLALSWSPSFCAANGKNADQQQCGIGGNHGFIVHGLWPQFEKGYPEFCPANRHGIVSSGLEKTLFDLMPSSALVRHQWRKHGTCSGLEQRAYFDTLRAARQHVTIPGQFRNPARLRRVDPARVETAFIGANKGLSADGIAVTCGMGYLRDVRICMTRDLAFRPCDEVDRNACRLRSVLLPPSK